MSRCCFPAGEGAGRESTPTRTVRRTRTAGDRLLRTLTSSHARSADHHRARDHLRPRRPGADPGRRVGRPQRGPFRRRRPAAPLCRRLGTRPRAGSDLPHRDRTPDRGARPRPHCPGSRPLAPLRRQPALHGKPAPPGSAERRTDPRRPHRRHGSRPLPVGPRPPGAPPAPPAHPDRRRRGTWEDPRSGDPGQRADRPRTRPTQSSSWRSRAC